MAENNSKAVPHAEVKTLVQEHRAYARKHSDYDDKKHVRCVWFSINEVQAMLKSMEEEGADGLRVYFGRYPADVSGFPEPKPTPGTGTVVFVPTKVNDKGVAKSDYFDDSKGLLSTLNRGEQCEPHCSGTDDDLAD